MNHRTIALLLCTTPLIKALMPNRAILINNAGAECYFNNALQGAFASKSLCAYTQKFDFQAKPESIGNSYKKTLQQYIKIANDNFQKKAFLDTPVELTKLLFQEDPQLNPSSQEGTGKQGNPSNALAAIMEYSQKSFIKQKENGFQLHPCATVYEETSYCARAAQGNCTQRPSNNQKIDYIIKSTNIDKLDNDSISNIFAKKYFYTSRGRKCPTCGQNTLKVENSLQTLPSLLIIDTEDPKASYPFSLELSINTSTLTPHNPQIIMYQLIAVTMRTQKKATPKELLNPAYMPSLGGHYYALARHRNTWYLTDEPESPWWYQQPKDITTINKQELLLTQALKQLKNYETALFLATEANANYQKIMTSYGDPILEKELTIEFHGLQQINFIAQQGYLERFIKEFELIELFDDVPSLLFYEEVLRQDVTISKLQPSQINPLPQLQQELLLLGI
jgi:hypothetical protein